MHYRLPSLAAIALVISACAAPAVQDSPVARPGIGADGLRLDGSARPLGYTLHLVIDPRRERFSGDVSIDVEIVQALDSIVLHGRGLDVSEAIVVRADGRRQRIAYEERDGVARLRLGETLSPQHLRVELRYTAAFAQDLGLYRFRHEDLDYAVTQFEAIDARQAFPCFDEPRFKVPFDVILDVPRGFAAIASTPQVETLPLENGLMRVRFARTAPLPTYLIAFAVGPFAVEDGAPVTAAAVARPDVPLRFVATRGAERGLRHARAPTTRFLQALEAYFDMPYPYAKLDVIAVPDFDAGAMENVGAIMFASDGILLTEPIAAADARLFALTMSHELAHQWFGNLVTMPWWDDIWLNEAFASWMQYRIVDELYPEHRAALERLLTLHDVLAEDALATARRIREPIRSEHDIENSFDDITYEKGAAVLAMFEHYLGPDVFRAGIRAHLARYANGTADSAALIDSLERVSGKRVRAALTSFIDQPGVPIVSAHPQCTDGAARVSLTQQRYRPLGSATPEQRWQIPVCLRYSASGRVDERCTLLTDEQADLPLAACPDWLVPNADFAGYYHWSLPADWYGRLAQAVASLTAEEQLSLADSVDAAFASGQLDVGSALAAMSGIARSDVPEVALAPIAFFRLAGQRLVAGTAASSGAARFAASLYPPGTGTKAFDADYMHALPSDSDRLYHAAVAVFVARAAGDGSTRAAGVARAQEWAADPERAAIAPEALPAVLEIGASYGDDALFAALLGRLERSDGALRETLLKAIARTTVPARAERVRALALSGAVRDGERATLLLEQSAQSENIEATWDWLQTHFDQVARHMPANNAAELSRVAAFYCDRSHARDVQAFFSARSDAYRGGPRNLAKTIEHIELCAALADRQRQDAIDYFSNIGEPSEAVP
jgi:alanyl aminopeptidase